MARAIMIQGTMSNAGKSVIAAALCRIFKQDGYSVAPFKSQNMALNSYITEDGLEIGRAQAVQAEAAGIKPSVYMNPILLKPTSDMGSQVIVNGVARANMKAADYFKYKTELIPDIMKAYNTLANQHDIIVIEGAGSPAEINLKQNDIVNMGMAKMADAPVLLAADIDRGGVFAQLYGTAELLEKDEKARIKGMIINKFRGDLDILQPGIDMIEKLTGIKNVGVIPYADFDIDDEDSLSPRFKNKKSGIVDIAVIRFPRISNFTDFNAFDRVEGVSLRYVSSVRELGKPDMIILPGTKNTIADLKWFRESGLEAAVIRASEDCVIFGICGGYQMLGEEIIDGVNAEGGGKIRGMGLLPSKTVFRDMKKTTQVSGSFKNISGALSGISGTEFEGYEIHMGETVFNGNTILSFSDNSHGGQNRGNVYGCYVHGIFDSCAADIARCLCEKKGIEADCVRGIDAAEYKEKEYNKLADIVRASLDMEYIYGVMK